VLKWNQKKKIEITVIEQKYEESSQTSIISYNNTRIKKLQQEIDQITSEITPYTSQTTSITLDPSTDNHGSILPYARGDHTHYLNTSLLAYDTNIKDVSTEISDPGTSEKYARGDHTHFLDTTNIPKIKTDMLEALNLGDIIKKLIIDEIDARIKSTIFPIGFIMVRYDNIEPSTLSGLEGTTWILINSGNYIRTTTSETEKPGLTGGSLNSGEKGSRTVADIVEYITVKTVSNSTGNASTTTTSNTSGSTTLTTSQIPSHTHDFRTCVNSGADLVGWAANKVYCYGASDRTQTWSGRTNESCSIYPTGGSEGHTHSIPSLTVNSHSHSIPSLTVNSHSHTVPSLTVNEHSHSIEPIFIKLAFWYRSA
jgi:microcystin-dependent protein